jgi:hypothetical protein
MTEFRDAKIEWDVIGYVAVHRAEFVGKVPSLMRPHLFLRPSASDILHCITFCHKLLHLSNLLQRYTCNASHVCDVELEQKIHEDFPYFP